MVEAIVADSAPLLVKEHFETAAVAAGLEAATVSTCQTDRQARGARKA
eukprot:CAMPEP_0180443158 /NCGR_PEP_ID=MMETSP1036_2-20121128/14524_1 /TAXON_ID=632150 /ORGANISM="Azadinium spinosum, Strain 3D9" /LENGTH=47 /DNA_ID= /DNA_START= /DNA_END= /DNA_ORIENTATION=